MRIGFVGAGRVAGAFSIYLQNVAVEIVGFYSRNFLSAERLANVLKVKPYKNLEELIGSSDIVAITTNDDNISKVVQNIVEVFNNSKVICDKKTFFHMSGSLNSEILSPLKALGHSVASFHPLQSIVDAKEGSKALQNCLFTVEGDISDNLNFMLDRINNPIIHIEANNKVLYHVAACMASNYMVALINECITILKIIGFSNENALTALIPLVEGTLENIKANGIEDALTGPIARGDVGTVQNHLDALKGNEHLLKVYKVLGQSTFQLIPNNIKEGMKSNVKSKIHSKFI